MSLAHPHLLGLTLLMAKTCLIHLGLAEIASSSANSIDLGQHKQNTEHPQRIAELVVGWPVVRELPGTQGTAKQELSCVRCMDCSSSCHALGYICDSHR